MEKIYFITMEVLWWEFTSGIIKNKQVSLEYSPYLTPSTLDKNSSRHHFEIFFWFFFFFFQKIGFDMQCQSLFAWKNKKNSINLSFVEYAFKPSMISMYFIAGGCTSKITEAIIGKRLKKKNGRCEHDFFSYSTLYGFIEGYSKEELQVLYYGWC